MSTSSTPSLTTLKRAIDLAEQIETLKSQLTALLGGSATVKVAVKVAAGAGPRARGRKGTMSPEARERIAAAQRARWAKARGTSVAAPPETTKPVKKKRNLTPAGRARLAAAMKARWAARKKGGPSPLEGKKGKRA